VAEFYLSLTSGVNTAPPAAAPAPGDAPLTAKGFIAFERMAGITNALNLAHKGTYKDLQTIPAGGSWEESFWITTKGY
jgi:aldose 1-epimerase